MLKVFLLCLLTITLCQSQGLGIPINLIPHWGKLEPKKAPEYRLDLNVEPRHRWDHIAPDFAGPVKQFQTRVLDLLPLSQSFYNTLGLFVETTPIYHEYVEELKGIAYNTDTDWKKLMFAQFIYDISSIIPHPNASFCSSILAKDITGRILHGRNMDFWPWGLFSKDTAKIKVYRGEKYVAEFDQIIGSVFVLSGIKKGSFSVTVDTRKFNHGEGGLKELIQNVMVNKYMPSAFLTRELLQRESITYEEARDEFKNTNVTAPIYYIVGGLDSGCIIEKNPVKWHGFYEISPKSKEWFLVQTNYDKEEDPGLDDRKTPATKRLEAIGQNTINIDNFYEDVLMQYPTINITSIYNTMMIPTTGYNDFKALYGTIDDFVPYQPSVESNLRKQNTKQQFDENMDVEDPYYNQLLQEGYLSFQEIIRMEQEFLSVKEIKIIE